MQINLNHSLLSKKNTFLKILALLVGEWCYIIVVLNCVSLITLITNHVTQFICLLYIFLSMFSGLGFIYLYTFRLQEIFMYDGCLYLYLYLYHLYSLSVIYIDTYLQRLHYISVATLFFSSLWLAVDEFHFTVFYLMVSAFCVLKQNRKTSRSLKVLAFMLSSIIHLN